MLRDELNVGREVRRCCLLVCPTCSLELHSSLYWQPMGVRNGAVWSDNWEHGHIILLAVLRDVLRLDSGKD